jgi:hypothetical protein
MFAEFNELIYGSHLLISRKLLGFLSKIILGSNARGVQKTGGKSGNLGWL